MILASILTVSGILGCNLLTPLIFIGDHKKKTPAEFDRLADARVAILVWADASTLFDYPYARFELSSYVADKLTQELGQRKVRIDLVDPRKVEDFLQRDPQSRIDPLRVGKQFEADFVIHLEVLTFQMRHAQQPQFAQGRIESSVVVHEIRAAPQDSRRFDLNLVETVYPPNAPVILSATNATLVREATYRQFAEQVVRKFHEFTESS